MVTKREILAALENIGDDDEVIVAIRTPEDDEGEKGFAETEGGSEPAKKDDEDPGYITVPVDDTEIVDAVDDSGAHALLLYVDLPGDEDDDEDDDTIFVDDEGHYVDSEDNYITKEGEPSDVPVKADPEDLED